jgi:CRISPR-associated protein Csm4
MPGLLRCRLRLDPASPLRTPLTSGTLFGHLAWAKRDRDGEPALEAWLDRLGREPFALSDALPAERLPRPLLPPPPPPLAAPRELSADDLKQLDEKKEVRRRNFISLHDWRDLRVGLSAEKLERRLATDGSGFKHARTPHNVIDRRNGHTLEQAGLWFADEDWPDANATTRDLYVRGTVPQAELADLLRRVGEQGYGRAASTGRGQFTLKSIEPVDWLDDVPQTAGVRRMLSLSHGTLTPNMQAPRYKRMVLFGKVGKAMLAEVDRPWKLPILLMCPGATFEPADTGPFGAWLTGVHQDQPRIGQNAFHLAIPYTEATP